MKEAILHFPEQFTFKPEIMNKKEFPGIEKFILCGMGGSALAGDIVRNWQPDISMQVHKDYGIPQRKSRCLIIVASYSGNTEETISSFNEARKRGLPLFVITAGVKLKELAIKNNVPYIELPTMGIQPRAAVGFQLVALSSVIAAVLPQKETILKDLSALKLSSQEFEEQGKAFAKNLKGKTPLIYGSSRWQALVYNWKIKFNENSKIAAFWNLFPELNHNEMTGFDVTTSTKDVLKNFHFILLKDPQDNPRILKRQEIFEKILKGKGFLISSFLLEGKSFIEKFFNSTLLADWTSYHLALEYGNDPEQVPLVEEFKKLIA